MPREWHDRHTVNQMSDPVTKKFYRDIVADKKPYFMRYIYPALMKQYNTYIKNTDRNALREFGMTVDELMKIPYEKLTDRQQDFLRYFKIRMPVGVGDCVMNKICRKIESIFDGYISKITPTKPFNYEIMKSGAEYSKAQRLGIQRLYDDYMQSLQQHAVHAKTERLGKDDIICLNAAVKADFVRACEEQCPNSEVLCDIILDICYKRNNTKRFAWDICAEQIIQNLIGKNGGKISTPVYDDDGDITYCGGKFKMVDREIGEN